MWGRVCIFRVLRLMVWSVFLFMDSRLTLTYQNLLFLWVLIISPNIDFIGTLRKSRFWRVKVGSRAVKGFRLWGFRGSGVVAFYLVWSHFRNMLSNIFLKLPCWRVRQSWVQGLARIVDSPVHTSQVQAFPVRALQRRVPPWCAEGVE